MLVFRSMRVRFEGVLRVGPGWNGPGSSTSDALDFREGGANPVTRAGRPRGWQMSLEDLVNAKAPQENPFERVALSHQKH